MTIQIENIKARTNDKRKTCIADLFNRKKGFGEEIENACNVPSVGEMLSSTAAATAAILARICIFNVFGLDLFRFHFLSPSMPSQENNRA
jgi:hypothetical protein